MDDLVGADDIAARLGVARRQVVHNWHARGIGFPSPLIRLHGGPLWYWPEVAAWARETGRLR